MIQPVEKLIIESQSNMHLLLTTMEITHVLHVGQFAGLLLHALPEH